MAQHSIRHWGASSWGKEKVAPQMASSNERERGDTVRGLWRKEGQAHLGRRMA